MRSYFAGIWCILRKRCRPSRLCPAYWSSGEILSPFIMDIILCNQQQPHGSLQPFNVPMVELCQILLRQTEC